MRPTQFICAAMDDDEDLEPMTVPRPRAHSGVCLSGEGGGPEQAAEEDRWSLGDEPSSSPGADPAHESGIYPIFEDGDAALMWVKQRRAVQQCTTEIETAPDDPLRYLKRARAKVELGTLKEALEDCTRAVSIRPDCVEAYVTRADIEFDMQSYAECAADCTKALRIDRTCVDAFERRASACFTIGGTDARIDEWKLHIVQRRGARQQVERLEDEADLLIPDARQLVVIHLAHLLAVEQVASFCWSVEAADQVHQRRFARP